MRHYHTRDAAYIEALTGQSWLAAELIECSHIYRVPLPYPEQVQQDQYIRQVAGVLLDTDTCRGYNVLLVDGSIAIF